MSQRERWVVYPLLFLALGLALRDKLVPPKSLTAGMIWCDQLEVLGQADCHQLTVHDAAGNPRVRLTTLDHGGRLELDAREGQTTLVLGADDDGLRYGLFALRPGGKRLVPLSLYDMPWLGPESKEHRPPSNGDKLNGGNGPRPPAS